MKRAIYILLFGAALVGYSFPAEAQRGSARGGSPRSSVGAVRGGASGPGITSRSVRDRGFVGGQERYRGGGHYGGGHYRHGGHGHFSGGSHFSGGIFLGPGWGPWWGYPFSYSYPYPYYTAPPVVIEQGPQEYIYQEAQPEVSYWYFCKDPEGYYPYVKRCPDGWLKVVPSATPEDQED